MWFKVDDSLPTHHRVIAAGNAAIGLWVRCGAWSMGQLTDGFIPTAVAAMFGTPDEVQALLDSGLWITADGGYQFHRWAEDGSGAPRQPTRAEIEEKRKADRERKQQQASNARKAIDRKRSTVAEASARIPSGIRADSTDRSVYPDPTRPDPLLSPPSKEGGASATPPVDNSDTEPPQRCPAHMSTDNPPRCGQCKDARKTHEAWEQRGATVHQLRPPKYDPTVYCEHLQLIGACDICSAEQARAAQVLTNHFGDTA